MRGVVDFRLCDHQLKKEQQDLGGWWSWIDDLDAYMERCQINASVSLMVAGGDPLIVSNPAMDNEPRQEMICKSVPP